jgi:hypothetical protein
MAVQAQLVTALCALHNFIRYRDPHELHAYKDVTQSYDNCFRIPVQVPQAQAELGGGYVSPGERTRAEAFRDRVAEGMWTQYQAELLRRQQRRRQALQLD